MADMYEVVTVTLKLAKETSNTYRFEEVDNRGNKVDFQSTKVGTVYVKKRLFDAAPDMIEVAIRLVA